MVLKLSNCDGHFVIDDEDFAFVSIFKWRRDKDGYAIRTRNVLVKGEKPLQKRQTLQEFLLGRVEGKMIDHINRNRLDNRRSNLRYADNSINQINRVHVNKHGFRGVHKRDNRYYASCCKNGVRKEKWGFGTKEEAAQAYNELALEMHGQFAMLNKV